MNRKRKKNYKNDEKGKQLEVLLVRINYTDKPDKLENALKVLNEIRVKKILHEILKKKY